MNARDAEMLKFETQWLPNRLPGLGFMQDETRNKNNYSVLNSLGHQKLRYGKKQKMRYRTEYRHQKMRYKAATRR